VPHGHWKTLTFIAALRCDGVTAPYVLDGPMDGRKHPLWTRGGSYPRPLPARFADPM
jgi:hypothetical protein